ncbi:MAG: ABC transporter ATP-binding protein [Anaerolinea sp.]|nr:ABC transporter ATP-binding protein [Anaerolinea sp.]
MINETSNTQIIFTQNVSKAFDGVPAVEKLNLDIPPGVIFGFIGPSGCGKTTSVRLLLGIYTADSGKIEVLDRTPKKFGRRERVQIGYMPQQFVLYPELTVWENLNFAASLYGVPLRRKKRLQELLELVELTGQESKKVHNLSGGMQRRLSLAASIVHNPQLLFLDEPTAGIDPVLRRKFWDYFQKLKEEGHTLFITTQYVSEAVHCDYVGLMVNGRLLMVETPDNLRRRALGGDIIHLYTSSFLTEGQFNELRRQPFVLEGKVSRLRNQGVEIVVDEASTILPLLLNWCQEEQIPVESASEYVPVFDDVFVELINQETAAEVERVAEETAVSVESAVVEETAVKEAADG